MAQLSPYKSYVIEALYPSQNGQNILPAALQFCPAENFNSNCASLTRYSDNAYMLKIEGIKSTVNGFFEPVSQIKYKQKNITHTATLYYDGIYYIELENEDSIYKKRITQTDNITIKAENINENTLLAIYGDKGGKKYCQFFGFNDDYHILGEYYADSIKVEKEILITNTLNDMCQNTVVQTLSFDGATLSVKDKKVNAKKEVKKIDRLIPYYFLEALLAENFEVAKSLLNKDNYKDIEPIQLHNFFGEFNDILQNPYEKKLADYIAVKQKITNCYYELKYYNFVIKDGLIENIIAL